MSSIAQFPVKVFNVVLSSTNKVFCIKNEENIFDLPAAFLQDKERVSAEVERVIEKDLGLCVGLIKEDLKYFHARFATNEAGQAFFEVYTVSRYLSGAPSLGADNYQWIGLDAVDNLPFTVEARRILYKMISNTDKVSSLILSQKGASVILVARALIKNEEGKYLFLKRTSTEAFPNQWELPGGKLERLEGLETHLKREVLEETSLSVRIEKNNVYTGTSVMPEGVYKGVTYVNITAECSVIGGRIKLSYEHSGYQWVSPEEAVGLDLTYYMKPVINELLLSK